MKSSRKSTCLEVANPETSNSGSAAGPSFSLVGFAKHGVPYLRPNLNRFLIFWNQEKMWAIMGIDPCDIMGDVAFVFAEKMRKWWLKRRHFGAQTRPVPHDQWKPCVLLCNVVLKSLDVCRTIFIDIQVMCLVAIKALNRQSTWFQDRSHKNTWQMSQDPKFQLQVANRPLGSTEETSQVYCLDQANISNGGPKTKMGVGLTFGDEMGWVKPRARPLPVWNAIINSNHLAVPPRKYTTLMTAVRIQWWFKDGSMLVWWWFNDVSMMIR